MARDHDHNGDESITRRAYLGAGLAVAATASIASSALAQEGYEVTLTLVDEDGETVTDAGGTMVLFGTEAEIIQGEQDFEDGQNTYTVFEEGDYSYNVYDLDGYEQVSDEQEDVTFTVEGDTEVDIELRETEDDGGDEESDDDGPEGCTITFTLVDEDGETIDDAGGSVTLIGTEGEIIDGDDESFGGDGQATATVYTEGEYSYNVSGVEGYEEANPDDVFFDVEGDTDVEIEMQETDGDGEDEDDTDEDMDEDDECPKDDENERENADDDCPEDEKDGSSRSDAPDDEDCP